MTLMRVPPSLGITAQMDGKSVLLKQFDQNSQASIIQLTRHECAVIYDFLEELLAGDFDQEKPE